MCRTYIYIHIYIHICIQVTHIYTHASQACIHACVLTNTRVTACFTHGTEFCGTLIFEACGAIYIK